MKTRSEAIEFCLTFPLAFEDYPFDDFNWTVMRRRDTRRGFCWIFERNGEIWLNLKSDPETGRFLREIYSSVLPGYHMNKEHWISVILDGTVPEKEIEHMISASFDLCGKNTKRR